MNRILIEKSPSPGKLEVLGVESWQTKTMAAGNHTREYRASEECYISAGKATLACGSQPEETVCSGDLLFIPQGLTVTWKINDPIEYQRRSSQGQTG